MLLILTVPVYPPKDHLAFPFVSTETIAKPLTAGVGRRHRYVFFAATHLHVYIWRVQLQRLTSIFIVFGIGAWMY